MKKDDSVISRKAVDRIIDKWLANPDYELKYAIYDMTKKIHKLPSVNTEPRWIPVNERLPENRDEVLISLADGRITIASYNDHFLPFFNKPIGWGVDTKRFVFDFSSEDVIAWMPLPEPYKEVEE